MNMILLVVVELNHSLVTLPNGLEVSFGGEGARRAPSLYRYGRRLPPGHRRGGYRWLLVIEHLCVWQTHIALDDVSNFPQLQLLRKRID